MFIYFRLADLETALADDCTCNDIYTICRGKLIPEYFRPAVWKACLDIKRKGNQISQFNEIFDLPNQNSLREHCQQFVDKLGNEEYDKVSVVSDLESVLTFYCKNRHLEYESNNGWIEILLPILALKFSLSDTYNLFENIRDSYIPRGCENNGNTFHVFRLLLQYHDPELCSFLDTKRIKPDSYTSQWFLTLFASTCRLPVLMSMWDLYFQRADPFFVFFLALIMIVNQKDQILLLKNKSKEYITETLANMPCELELEDIVDFCSLASYYENKTPKSFKTKLLAVLYGTHVKDDDFVISQALCLPVSVEELVDNSSPNTQNSLEIVRFFLVDCRPAEQYNAGHFPTAFHLDCNLMLQEPAAFSVAVQGLLSAQRQALAVNSQAGGEHLCFLGSGNLEEDQYAHMVVASFLQKQTQFVSLLTGGFAAIHKYFGNQVDDYLRDHDIALCNICAKEGRSQFNMSKSDKNYLAPSGDLLGKLSAAMKSKSAEVKGKLFDYIVNPNVGQNTVITDRHVLSSERNGKRYRNVAPVFSIDDENDDSTVSEPPSHKEEKEIINVQEWLKKPEVIKSFKCQEVQLNGYMYDSHLLVTNTHMIVLRDLQDAKGKAQVIVSRPLSNIVKITAKKRHRDLITFKYGIPSGDTLLISDMDKFLIPNASDATTIISKQIVMQLNRDSIE